MRVLRCRWVAMAAVVSTTVLHPRTASLTSLLLSSPGTRSSRWSPSRRRANSRASAASPQTRPLQGSGCPSQGRDQGSQGHIKAFSFQKQPEEDEGQNLGCPEGAVVGMEFCYEGRCVLPAVRTHGL